MTPPATNTAAPPASLCAPEKGSRRAEIALVAADQFTWRGYHSTRVEHIAEQLSVTPGALYRHVPGKYEMFRDAVATLVTALETASEHTSDVGSGPPPLEELVESITRTTWSHRSRAALYRWQARYLTPEDRAAVREVDTRVRRRLADAVRVRRRQHHRDPAGAGSAAAAMLSCVASLGQHRITLSEDEAVSLMTSIAVDLALCDGSASGVTSDATNGVPSGQATGRRTDAAAGASSVPRLRGGAATREGAITAAIARFHRSGYDSVTMEAIGADVGVAASALYRHFPGKSALLTAAVDRTATLFEDLLDTHAARHTSGADPAVALQDLLNEYVTIAFSHGPDLMLYLSELGALSAEDRQRTREAQRRQRNRWADLLVAAADANVRATRATGSPSTESHVTESHVTESLARARVHAALAVVLDGGQGTEFHPAAAARFGQLAGHILIPHRPG